MLKLAMTRRAGKRVSPRGLCRGRARPSRRRSGAARSAWVLAVSLGIAVLAIGAALALSSWRVRWRLKGPREKARLLRRMRQFDEAIKQYERAVADSPEDPELLLGLAECHEARGSLKAAAHWAMEAAKYDKTGKAELLFSRARLAAAAADSLLAKRLSGSEVTLTDEQAEGLRSAARHARAALKHNPDSSPACQVAAAAMLLLGKPDRALSYGRRAVAVDRESVPARLLLARLLTIEGQLEAALEQSRHAVSVLKTRHRAPVMLAATLCARLGRFGEAAVLLRDLLEHRRGDTTARLLLARCCLEKGDYKAAEAEAAQVLRYYETSDVVNVGAYRVHGAALVKLGRHSDALVDLGRAAAHAPSDGEVHYWLGVAHVRNGQPTQGREALLDAVRLRPHADAYDELARLLVDEGRPEEALRQYRKGVEALGGRPQARQHLIDFCIEQGMTAAAEAELNKLLEQNPRAARAALQLADLYLQNGHAGQALALANYARRLNPDNADVRLLLARVQALHGLHEDAAQNFAAVVRREPKQQAAYLQWAAMHEAAGQPGAAEKVYRRALAALPQSLRLRCAYAKFCLQAKRVKDGLRMLRELLAKNPGEMAPRVVLVEHLLAIGAPGAAEAEARKCAAARPDSAAARSLVARVYRHRGDWGSFRDELERIAEMDPQSLASYQRVATDVKRGHYSRAVEVAREALEQLGRRPAPTRADEQRKRTIRLDLAVALFLNGQAKDAVDTARELSAVTKRDADVGYIVSLIELAAFGNAPYVPACAQSALPRAGLDAWAELAKLHDKRPEDVGRAARALLKAFVYHNAGWRRVAAATCQEIAEILPDTLLARAFVPVVWQRAGDGDRALELLQRAAAQRPDCDEGQHLLADLLLLRGEPRRSLGLYRAAPRRGDEPLEAILKHALLAYAMGDHESAIATWTAVLNIQPRHVEANNNLAWTLATLPGAALSPAQAKLSLQAATAALKEAPNDPAVLDTVGWVHHRLGKDAAAAKFLEAAVAKGCYWATAHFHLAVVRAGQGRVRDARQLLGKAIDLEPHGAFVERARQLLAELGP